MYRVYAALRQKEEIFENAEAQMARFPLFQNYRGSGVGRVSRVGLATV